MGYGKTKRKAVEEEKVGSGTDFWRPADGENRIRIMPPWSPDEDKFWFKTGTHFNVGPDDRAVPCPAKSGVSERCFLCRLVDKLKKGDEDEQEEADNIAARNSYLINIVDYAHPEQGVQVWRCGVKAFAAIKRYWLKEDEYGDMTDLEDGYDIIVTKTGSGINTQYDVMPARKNTPFPPDRLLNHASDSVAEVYRQIADEAYELPALDQVQKFVDDDEMEAIYHGLSGSSTRTEKEDEDDRPRRRSRRDEDEDEDEDERPRRRGRDEDEPDAEEDERPRRRSRRSEDEEEEEPEGDETPEEEEERPRRSRRSKKDEDDGDDKKGSRASSRLRGRMKL